MGASCGEQQMIIIGGAPSLDHVVRKSGGNRDAGCWCGIRCDQIEHAQPATLQLPVPKL